VKTIKGSDHSSIKRRVREFEGQNRKRKGRFDEKAREEPESKGKKGTTPRLKKC